MKTINRQQCVVSTSPDGYNGPEAIFYFNNVIVKETTEKSQVPNQSTLYLKGEDYVLCILQNGAKNCLRQLEIGVKTDNLPRVYNAIKYLYANFCKSAERKNAFWLLSNSRTVKACTCKHWCGLHQKHSRRPGGCHLRKLEYSGPSLFPSNFCGWCKPTHKEFLASFGDGWDFGIH